MIQKILIVDDSPVARKILKSCIPEGLGYEIFFAQNGVQGVEQFREIRPDITFMDVTMPEMNGLEALEKIMEIDKDAVVVMATADIQARTLEKAKGLGAFMLLKKPVTKLTVQGALTRVEKQLDNRKDG